MWNKNEVKWLLYFLVWVMFFTPSCTKESIVEVEVPIEVPVPQTPDPYSFFVAGHAYGNPVDFQFGLYPPFVQKYDLIQADTLMQFGFLTGDFVPFSTEEYFEAADADIAQLDMDVFLVAGNHDVANRPLYESRYGNTFYSFTRFNDLFIVLDPNIAQWNIDGSQLSFLEQQLAFNSEYVDNIFVFFHQMLWWSPDNIFKNVGMNSMEGRDSTINFWTEVMPLFEMVDNEVVMFAGDMGAIPWNPGYMFYQSGHITFIGSGMGRGEEENFIIVSVDADKTISYQLVSLEGDDINNLGLLEDYVLP